VQVRSFSPAVCLPSRFLMDGWMMKQKKVLVISGSEDPMWPFLLKGATEQDRKHLAFLRTDCPKHSRVRYSTNQRHVQFRIDDQTYNAEEIGSVWMRRIVAPTMAEFPARLSEYCKKEHRTFIEGLEYALPDAIWVSKPSAINAAQQKARQLALATEIGFHVPLTWFTNDPDLVLDCQRHSPSIFKAVRSPRVPLSDDHYTTVFTTRLDEVSPLQIEGIMTSPGIIQDFVEKQADIRVTVFGKRVFPVLIDSQKGDRSRTDFRMGARHLAHVAHELTPDVEAMCLELVGRLGLLYGAIDLALVEDGQYVFFEINPNGQWGWLEEKVGLPMRRAFLDLLFQREY
jgi:glutathione synthase/RimK-type ligase-like ATP-grasp enzyme